MAIWSNFGSIKLTMSTPTFPSAPDTAALMVLFARVVGAGSFSAAARDLGVTRAAVAKQVAHLEDLVGAQLLRRTTRRMGLTEAGELFLEHSTRVESETHAALDAVSSMQGAVRGLLRVACPVSFAVGHLAPLVPEFLSAHPEVRIDLVLADAYADLVAERIDVAVRIGTLADSSLVARRLAPSRVALAASPAYLLRRGAPHTPVDLREHDCLVYTLTDSPDLWRFAGGDAVRVRGPLRANNGEMLLQAARAGVGIARLPTWFLAADVEAGTLVPLLDDVEQEANGIYAVTPPGVRATPAQASPKTRAFVEFLAARFGPEPPWDRVFRVARR